MPRTVPHRELRNDSGRILREVQNGETIAVTNRGVVVALLVPPPASPYATLRVRAARRSGGFGALPRQTRSTPSGEVLDELRAER